MELIKKKIKLITKIESVDNDNIVITPDTDINYCLKLNLTSTGIDLGFFNVLDELNDYVVSSTVDYYSYGYNGIGEELLD